MSFLAELRRRRVVKVAAAYAIVGWLLVEIATTVLPTFEAPQWALQTITFVIILGFPLAIILAWAFDITPEGVKSAANTPPAESAAPAAGQKITYVSQALILLAVGFLVVDQYLLSPQGDTPLLSTATRADPSNLVRRYSINLGPTEPIFGPNFSAYLALSPDGRRLAYAVRRDGQTQIYLRDLDQLEVRSIPGSNEAGDMFFSPDGDWLAFLTLNGELKKVPVGGGPVQSLASGGRQGTGGVWETDDSIVFSVSGASRFRLHRIPAVGGNPEPLEELPSAETVEFIPVLTDYVHGTPDILPGGTHLLYSTQPIIGSNLGNASDGYIAVLTLATGEARTLVEGAYDGRYVPSGHIVFMRSATLWAVPFDPVALRVIGTEVPVVSGVETSSNRGHSVLAISDEGLLVYRPGVDMWTTDTSNHLVWVDRDGQEKVIDLGRRIHRHPRVSPDGVRIATSVIDSDGVIDVWVHDPGRGIARRLTFDSGGEERPLWTPDGLRLIYQASPADAERGLFTIFADGTGQPERLTNPSLVVEIPEAFTPDGANLVTRRTTGENPDLFLQPMEGDLEPRPLIISSEFAARSAAISPDGQWLAYGSNESGREEIFVQPFPDVDGGKWQVSTAGGREPRWGPDGSELFYREGESMMLVAIETEPTFLPGRPSVLFAGDYSRQGRPSYDVSPDGQRFLMLTSPENQETAYENSGQDTELVIVDNWFEELRRLAPPVGQTE